MIIILLLLMMIIIFVLILLLIILFLFKAIWSCFEPAQAAADVQYIHKYIYIYIYVYIYIYIHIQIHIYIQGPMSTSIGLLFPGQGSQYVGVRKGTNGVSTNGVTANFMVFDRDFLGTNLSKSVNI